MTEEEMKNRTKQFAMRIVRLFRSLPTTLEAQIIGKQILRSGTSTAANYRAACRAKSSADFTSKLSIVEEEADETCFWLEIIIEANILNKELVMPLLNEANEIVAIIVSSLNTTKMKKV